MMELAMECKKIKIFTHMSTCYVNCDKQGFIKEQIYPINEDPEAVVNRIMAMSPEE